MRNLWHNLQHFEGSQYLIEVEVEEVEGCVIPVPLATPVVLLSWTPVYADKDI